MTSSSEQAGPPPERKSLAEKADSLLALHVPGVPVILPTVWDAWSANLAVQAGFAGVTVGSHPVADSLGRADGEGMAYAELLGRVREITEAVQIPVSVDIESGYGLGALALIDGLLEAGAVGLNIEDTVHSEGGRERSDAEHAELVAGLRAAADDAEVHVVINARSDILLKGYGPEDSRVERIITRLSLAADAGADVLYPVGRFDESVTRRLVTSLPLPINAIGLPAQDDPAVLATLGVARVSFGPFLQMALADHAASLLARWR